MQRFLIIEPNEDIQRLYAAVVRGLGHVPAFPSENDVAAADVVLVEPSDPDSFELAYDLRQECPDLPIVCASVHAPFDDAEALRPVAYLLKPFSLLQLTDALQAAACRRELCTNC